MSKSTKKAAAAATTTTAPEASPAEDSAADSSPYATTIIELRREQIVLADWNYKKPGTPEQLERLAASIRRDRSPGVLAVRRRPDLGADSYEAIDGNHRVEAVFEYLKWPFVRCESFGEISLAEAVLIARRRNYQWFEDDLPQVSLLYKDVVLPAFGTEELVTFMPETGQQIEELAKLTDFDWESLPSGEPSASSNTAEPASDAAATAAAATQGLSFALTEEVTTEWMQWLAVAREHGKGDTPEAALVYALRCAFAFISEHADVAATTAEEPSA